MTLAPDSRAAHRWALTGDGEYYAAGVMTGRCPQDRQAGEGGLTCVLLMFLAAKTRSTTARQSSSMARKKIDANRIHDAGVGYQS